MSTEGCTILYVHHEAIQVQSDVNAHRHGHGLLDTILGRHMDLLHVFYHDHSQCMHDCIV